jgi:hypothetical protein
MTVSGSFDNNATVREIIDDALSYCGKKSLAQTTDPNLSETCRKTFDWMLKFWQGRNIGLWLIDDITLFLAAGTQSYDIYGSGTHATTEFVKTEIATAGSATDLTIDVDSITGMTNGDYIGIELDDGTLQWTTINGVPAGTTVTITAALTDDTAVDNHVYTYTTKAQKFLDLVDVQFHQEDDTEYPINEISREAYKSLSQKSSTGRCTQIYTDFRIDRVTVNVWPTADSVKTYINMSARRRIDDLDSLSNTIAVPPEWLLPLSTNLAYWIAPKLSVDLNKIGVIKALADETLKTIMGFDQEDTSMFITPRHR